MSNKLNLEDKLKRLKEIQSILEAKPPLTESMKLLEEAFVLKNDIEKELQAMENRLVDLSKSNE
jgi:exonuclease VII small subunit